MTKDRISRLSVLAAFLFLALGVRSEDSTKCDTCVRGEGCDVQYREDLRRCDMERRGSDMLKQVACQAAAENRLDHCTRDARRKCELADKC